MPAASFDFLEETLTPGKWRGHGKLELSKRLLIPVTGLGILILLSGCTDSNPLGRKAISGKVTLDGKPLESGSVRFEPMGEAEVGSGAVITNGNFSIPAEKGLPPGEYRVRISAAGEGSTPAPDPEAAPGDFGPPPPDLIPPAWSTQSENTITVTADGENQFTFPVETSGG